MNSVSYKLYLISMIEFIINNKTQTDLEDYLLEYKSEFFEINAGDMYNGDACLAVATRLVNKNTSLVEYGKIFYKKLIKDCDAVSRESGEKLNLMLTQLLESTPSEKMAFILRPEGKILKTPYVNSDFVDPKLASFFCNLQYLSDGYPAVSLGGKFPKKAVMPLNVALESTLKLFENLDVDEKLRSKR